jgi:hypothetical protein
MEINNNYESKSASFTESNGLKIAPKKHILFRMNSQHKDGFEKYEKAEADLKP